MNESEDYKRPVVPDAHSASHEDGGTDEVNVGDLSGELADNQPPKDHASDHKAAGSDDLLSAPGAIGGATPAPGSFTTIDLAGGQMAFPATAVPSADPNTIDDYEEGTFAPGFSFGGASVGMVYAVQLASYTKIGNRLLFNEYVAITNKGSSNGAARITGLPFTVKDHSSAYATVSLRISNISFNTFPWARIKTGDTVIGLLETTAVGTTGWLTDVSFANDALVMLAGHYQI